MIPHALWSETWTAAIVNHLWQSTLFVLIAWVVTLMLRSNQARTRYWIWMIASAKFLIPFSILIDAGEFIRSLLFRSYSELCPDCGYGTDSTALPSDFVGRYHEFQL
jgi:hypothetical protein